jgi:MFS family permease
LALRAITSRYSTRLEKNDSIIAIAQFGLLTSVFLWVYGILSPFGGYFADKFSRKKVIILSLFVWSTVTLWTGFVHSFTEMLVARAVMGISEACYIPAALAWHSGCRYAWLWPCPRIS